VKLSAAASSSVRSALAGPARPATWLGATPAALYLQIAGEPGVLALLAHDAVRLPCALVLPTTRAELPLVATVVAADNEPLVGDGAVTWTGPAGRVVVTAVREWAPARVRRGTVTASAREAVRAALPALDTLGVDSMLLPLLASQPAAAVARLLGRGPGLTPAGDDVLAGFLVGARAFGHDAAEARAAVAALAPAHTTALSAALLWHAARGECIDELAAVVVALSRPSRSEGNPTERGLAGHNVLEQALGRLLAVGHTSGAALAAGLSAAAAAAANAMAAAPTTLYQQQVLNHDESDWRAGLRARAGSTERVTA
jgi:hypothetical protein